MSSNLIFRFQNTCGRWLNCIGFYCLRMCLCSSKNEQYRIIKHLTKITTETSRMTGRTSDVLQTFKALYGLFHTTAIKNVVLFASLWMRSTFFLCNCYNLGRALKHSKKPESMTNQFCHSQTIYHSNPSRRLRDY